MTGLPPKPEQASPEQLATFVREWNAHPAMQHMQARIDLTQPGVTRGVIDKLQPFHRGGMGTEAVTGAVIAAMIDLVIGLTGYMNMQGRQVGVAELHVHFLRPVLGNSLVVEGRPTRVGKRLVYVATELYDDERRLCATGSGITALAGESPGPSF